MLELKLTPEQQKEVKDSLLSQFKTLFLSSDSPLYTLDKNFTINEIYDYKINENGESVYELIVETSKKTLITYDFDIAPETEEEVEDMLDSVKIKLNIRTIDSTPIFNFFSPMKIHDILSYGV